jgi:hypothetical protein
VVAQPQRDDAVALHHRGPVVDFALEESLTVRVGARVRHVEPDVEAIGGVDERGIGARARQVERHRPDVDIALTADDVGQRIERARPARDEHDVDALRGDLAGEPRAGSFRRTADHGPRPVPFREVTHGPSP